MYQPINLPPDLPTDIYVPTDLPFTFSGHTKTIRYDNISSHWSSLQLEYKENIFSYPLKYLGGNSRGSKSCLF